MELILSLLSQGATQEEILNDYPVLDTGSTSSGLSLPTLTRL